jgi:hypothetical protein
MNNVSPNENDNNDFKCWELIENDNNTDNEDVPFNKYMYKVIACRHLYKHLLKPVTTSYEFRKKKYSPYNCSPLCNYVSIKYNINTNSNNDLKKLKKEVIVDGWVML